MTPFRIKEIAKLPHSVSDKEIEILETLSIEFPYYNLPHILLAKIYRLKESYKYEQQLKKASLRVISRKWLFDYINNTDSVESIEKLVDETIVENIIQDTHDSVVEIEKPVVEIIIEENDKIDLIEIEEDVIEQLIEEDNTINIKTELEEQIEVEIKEPILENQIEASSTQTEKEEIIKETTSEEVFTKSESKIIDSKLSFSDWLSKMSKPIDHEIKPKKKEHVIEVLKDVVNHKKVEEEIILPKAEKSSKPTLPKIEESISVIDAFLKKNPSISQPKTEFFKAEKAAKKSLELEDDIVTETLAGIYVKQGHIEQAIWAYEKLILKFPQKEAYFADLLNELKKNKE